MQKKQSSNAKCIFSFIQNSHLERGFQTFFSEIRSEETTENVLLETNSSI